MFIVDGTRSRVGAGWLSESGNRAGVSTPCATDGLRRAVMPLAAASARRDGHFLEAIFEGTTLSCTEELAAQR